MSQTLLFKIIFFYIKRRIVIIIIIIITIVSFILLLLLLLSSTYSATPLYNTCVPSQRIAKKVLLPFLSLEFTTICSDGAWQTGQTENDEKISKIVISLGGLPELWKTLIDFVPVPFKIMSNIQLSLNQTNHLPLVFDRPGLQASFFISFLFVS